MNRYYNYGMERLFFFFLALCIFTKEVYSQVNTFTLVNANTGQDIQTLSDGATLNLATLPSKNLNVRANTSPATVGSVVFALKLNGIQIKTQTENVAPYTLFGDYNNVYYSWAPTLGSYTLTATPYTASDGTGTAGPSLSIGFVIISDSFSTPPPSLPPTVVGNLKKWQTVTINFTGPAANESDISPNPFLDYKLQVTFTNLAAGKTYNVPGFFDGDGTGGAFGNIWRVRFAADEEGQWSYTVSFRKGPNIAVDLNPLAGMPDSILDGVRDSFIITPPDSLAQGFLKRGRLQYSNGFYLKFQDSSYWIKGGTNSPENFLALPFASHVGDWQYGDPDWNNGEGKGIIGALNYLGASNVNSIYFLPMNIGGDAQDTWPFIGPIVKSGSTSNDDIHYNINKLTIWEKIFDHAQKKGLMLHFVLNEAEPPNKQELDNATLGIERKLFYRELVARFGHHNALQWNLCEEYNYKLPLAPSLVKTWAQYLQDIDPYNHPITVHNFGDPINAWTPFVGDSLFSLTSFQYAGSTAGHGNEVEKWRNITAAAGHPIPIFLDEFRATTTANISEQRKEILWPTYFSGGAGLEYYFGSQDQSLQNFRQYELLWNWTWYARKFMEENLPFWEMEPADDLLTHESSAFGGGQVFAKAGQIYAIYLPNASSEGIINLSGVSGEFELRWYNPRTGNFEGNVKTVKSGGSVRLGSAPSSTDEDWVVLLTNTLKQVVTKATFSNKKIIESETKLSEGLQVKAMPNLTSQYFTLITQSTTTTPLTIRVIDLSGRIIETITGAAPNGTVQMGNNYFSGVYYIEISQGNQRKTLKVIKQPN